MSKKKKPDRAPFYAQVLTQKVREEERRKALHEAARRVLLKGSDQAPKDSHVAS